MGRLARLPGLAGVAPGWRCRPIAVSAGMISASESLPITGLIWNHKRRQIRFQISPSRAAGLLEP